MTEVPLSTLRPSVVRGNNSSAVQTKKVSQKLLDIEILYLLNRTPSTLKELVVSLGQIFEIRIELTSLLLTVSRLREASLIQAFSEDAAEKSEVKEFSKRYALTQGGRMYLNESIEVLAEIVLTMQLGLYQRLVKV